VHQPRVRAAQRAGGQAEPVGGAGREVLHEDVGAPQQPVQERDVVRILQVDLEGLLGPVEPHEVAGLPVHRLVVPPREVSGTRSLHLDHPGAEVGELPGGERRRHRLLDADDGDPFERPHEPDHAS
jgi:hypothetical protein